LYQAIIKMVSLQKNPISVLSSNRSPAGNI